MSDDETKRYHFGLAQASLAGLFSDLDEAVRRSWKPDASVVRYRRHWQITKVLAEAPNYYYGRIGFVSPDEVETVMYDRVSHDFVHGTAPSGSVVPFVLRPQDGLVVYQLFPGVVRASSFIGALQGVLNAPGTEYVWDVHPLTLPMPFDQWRGQVERIASFDFRLDRPNPNYVGRPFVEAAIEGTRAESVRLAATAFEHESLDVDGGIFKQAMDHALRNYGRAKIIGVQADGTESVFRKPKGGVEQVELKTEVEAQGDGEAALEVLLQVLSSRELVGRSARDGFGDEDED